MRRHGELTAEFKEYLDMYCRDQNKTLADLDMNVEDNSEMVAVVASFIGLKPREVKMIFNARHRNKEAYKLNQMACVAKRCLVVKT